MCKHTMKKTVQFFLLCCLIAYAFGECLHYHEEGFYHSIFRRWTKKITGALAHVRIPTYFKSFVVQTMAGGRIFTPSVYYGELYYAWMKRPTYCTITNQGMTFNPGLCPAFSVLYVYQPPHEAKDGQFIWQSRLGITRDSLNITVSELAMPYSAPKCVLGYLKFSNGHTDKVYYKTCGRDGGKSILLPRTRDSIIQFVLYQATTGPKQWRFR